MCEAASFNTKPEIVKNTAALYINRRVYYCNRFPYTGFLVKGYYFF